MKHYVACLLLCTISMFCPSESSAQTTPEVNKNIFSSTITFQTWRLASDGVEERLSEVTLPLLIGRAFSQHIWLYVFQANAAMHREIGGESDTMSGLGDTKVRFTYSPFAGHVRLNAGLSLPTGKNLLSSSEADLANRFYSEILGFRVNRLGEGLDFHLAVSAAQPVSMLMLSAGASYLRKGSYEPMQGIPKYDPGDHLRGAVGWYWTNNRIGWQTHFAYTRYTADRFDDRVGFEQGDEMLIASTARWRVQTFQFDLRFTEFLRGKNRFPTMETKLAPEILNTNGNRREITLWAGYKPSPITRLRGDAGYHFTDENERDRGQSTVWQFTVGVDFQLTDHVSTQVNGRLAMGEMHGSTVNLQGLGAWVGVSTEFAR